MPKGQILIPWKAQPGPQQVATEKAWIDELFYGGARGGGKSSWLLGDFAQDIPREGGSTWYGILFRRTLPQLEDLIRKSQEMYPLWFGKDKVDWRVSDKSWTWQNGAQLKMRYAESPDDWMQYHGHEYTWIGYDELTTWPTPELYMKLKATLRSPNPLHTCKRIRATGNPGGPGHNWVKTYFGIDRYPLGGQLLQDPDTNRTRLYVKARVTDNKILLEADPTYVQLLKSTGSPEQVRAWLDGDWDAVQGAYFSEFSTAKHVLVPFAIPTDWTKLRMMDWGSAAPFSVLWGAISDGTPVEGGRVFPKGAMIIYREWYGGKMTTEGRWVGLKLRNEDIANGILDRESGERIDDSVIDPAAYAQNGGPSIAETMAKVTDANLMFRRGDNKRIPGWSQVRERLQGGEDGPMLYFFSTCSEIIRTLPSLPHDVTKPEDVDTDAEDHAPDSLRYGCMARIWTREPEVAKAPRVIGYTLDELWTAHDEGARRRRSA